MQSKLRNRGEMGGRRLLWVMVGDFFRAELLETDLALADALKSEAIRQACSLPLTASEKFVSKAGVLAKKRAEGYFGKRGYADCEFVDEIGELAGCRAVGRHGNGIRR
ncbi:MAG: hypothetical protein ACKERG_04515 [Candidatus Hodgkinia cicadicola]